MPVLLSADVREAFFKIRVAPASRHLLIFLIDYDTKTQQLTAKVTEHSKLVTIQASTFIMGVSQSQAYRLHFKICQKVFQTTNYDGFYSTFITWMIYK